MHDEWRQVVLSDLVEIATAGISAEELASKPEVHHYSLPAFDLGRGPDVGPGDAIKSNKTLVPRDCILFSKLNPRIPRVWRVEGVASPDSYCSTEFWPLVRKSAEVDLDFLTYFLSSPTFLSDPAIVPSSSTNSHQRVDRRSFESFALTLPPLKEQQRITEVLRSVDEAIAAATSVADRLDASLRAAVEDFVQSSAGEGERIPIGQLATFVGSGVTPKGGKDAYLSAGIPLIRSQNVHFDGLRRDGLVFIDAATDAKMARTRVQPEDVLLNITGASIGRCTTVPPDFGLGNVNQHVCIIRTDRSRMHPAFLAIFLSSYDGQRQIDQLQGGLSREGLNFQQVRAIEVPVPTLDAQALLTESISSLRAAATIEAAHIAKMQELRSGLMGDLLSGRVRVPT